MSFSPVEIARQFCLIVNSQYKYVWSRGFFFLSLCLFLFSFSYFSLIYINFSRSLKISHFHKLRFLNSETSPTIGTMIHFSNVMVSTLSKLISLSNAQNQPKVIKKIINIGKVSRSFIHLFSFLMMSTFIIFVSMQLNLHFCFYLKFILIFCRICWCLKTIIP